MTNMVPPLTQPMVDAGNNPSSLNGSINNPSTDLSGLSVGQQITVQINPQSLSQLGTNILLNMDISLPDMGEEKQSINTSVELPQQLKLPSYPVEMQIRITAHTPQKIEFRVVNIDGKPASSFVPKTSETLTNTTSSVQISSTSTGLSSVQQHPLLPLKVQPLLEQTFLASSLSSTQTSELVQSSPNYQLKLEISHLHFQPSQSEQPQVLMTQFNTIINSTPNYSQTILPISQQPTPTIVVSQLPSDIVDTLVVLIKDTLSPQTSNNFLSGETQLNLSHSQKLQVPTTSSLPPVVDSQSLQPVQPSMIEYQNQLLPQLEQTLKRLIGKEFPAQVIDKGELKVLQTSLGEVVPELPLKLEAGEKLLLKISDIIIPKTLKEDDSFLSPLSNKIIEILKPLQSQLSPNAFMTLVSKIPADNNKMLSNIISFLKAAETENITDWLGKELTDTIRLSGTKGQETLSQLENLIVGRKEENSQWRIIEVPFFDADNLSKIRVAIRKYRSKDSSHHAPTSKPDAARFVVDTAFSALGAFQFDGFSIAKDKRFDLIIRTEKDIADDLYTHIMQLFRSSLSTVDYAGNIRINIKEKFIKLCEDESESTILQDGLYI